MDYFPIFIHTRDRKVVFVGGAEDIGHKLILLGKSSAHRHVYGDISDPRVSAMITSGEVTHHAMPCWLGLMPSRFPPILLCGCRKMSGLRQLHMRYRAISNGFYMVDSFN